MASPTRAYRAGESLEDFCRACKTDRLHTVIVADPNGLPIRVSCGFCHSEHNYRGGPRIGVEARGISVGADPSVGPGRTHGSTPTTSRAKSRPRSQPAQDSFPIVS